MLTSDATAGSATDWTRRYPGETPALVRPVIRAEFFTRTGLDILVAHTGLAPPLRGAAEAYL